MPALRNSLADEYARTLSGLEGDAFEAEVCARLRAVILGFQDVPRYPRGDGGLDAFSHSGERGYCCYGPAHNAFKTNQSRTSDIIKKFSGDLMWLFELVSKSRKVIHRDNHELATILGKGRRLKSISLIVNWFESHRILGPIQDKLVDYKSLSLCRYVDPSVTVVVLGPKQLANDYAVDEITLARARERTFIKKVQDAAGSLPLANPKNFDSKMDLLQEIRADQIEAVKSLANRFRDDWRTALAFERELGDMVPMLHRSLELARSQILARVAGLMVATDRPWAELPAAIELAERILATDFGRLYPSLLPSISAGEVARLVGECTIGWKKPAKRNA